MKIQGCAVFSTQKHKDTKIRRLWGQIAVNGLWGNDNFIEPVPLELGGFIRIFSLR